MSRGGRHVVNHATFANLEATATSRPHSLEQTMAIRVLPYVTLDVDDHLRRRVRLIGERLRDNLRSYLLSAADDVDTAGERVRDLCDAAVHRVDSVVTRVNDKIDPSGTPEPDPERPVRLQAV